MKKEIIALGLLMLISVNMVGCLGSKSDNKQKVNVDNSTSETVSDIKEEESTVQQTTEYSEIDEKMLNVKNIIDKGEFVEYFIKPAMYLNECLREDATEAERWRVVAYAYRELMDTEYLSDTSIDILLEDKSYKVVQPQDIEEICKIYFGRVLNVEEINIESNITYSDDNDVYYVPRCEYIVDEFKLVSAKEKSSDKIVVIADMLRYYYGSAQPTRYGQVKVTVKYDESTKNGFTIAKWRYTSFEEEYNKIDQQGKENSLLERSLINKEKSEQLRQQIVDNKHLWYDMLYRVAYANTDIKDEFSNNFVRALAYTADAINAAELDIELDKDLIEIVKKNGLKYFKINEDFADEIWYICNDPHTYIESRYFENEEEGFYDSKEDVYYIKVPKKCTADVIIKDSYFEEIEFEGEPSEYAIVFELVDKKQKEKEYIVEVRIDTDVKVGFNIYGIWYE